MPLKFNPISNRWVKIKRFQKQEHLTITASI